MRGESVSGVRITRAKPSVSGLEKARIQGLVSVT